MELGVEELTRDGSYVGGGVSGGGLIRSPGESFGTRNVSVTGESFGTRNVSVTFENRAQGARSRATEKVYALARLPVELDAFQAVCRSVKGRSNRTFCVDKNCVVNHQGSSLVPLKPGDLYVVNQPGRTGFIEPTLSHNLVAEDLLGDFLSSQRSLDAWRADFERVLSASPDAIDGVVTKKDYEVILAEESLALLDTVKTPARPSKKSRKEGDDLDMDDEESTRAPVFPGMEFLSESVPSVERISKIVEMVKLLDSDVSEMFARLVTLSDKEEADVRKLEKVARNMFLKVKMLNRDVLGICPPEVSMELGTSTLWGAVTALLEMVEGSSNAAPIQRPTTSNSPPLLDRMQQLEQNLFALAQGTQSAIQGLEPPTTSPPSSNFQEDFDKIKRQVGALRSAADSTSVKFGNLGFESMDDARSWLELHLPAHDVGLITDPHTVMENIFAAGDSDFLKDFEKVAKLEIQSLSKGIAMKSFQQSVPKYFCKQTTSVVDTDGSYFSRILKVEDWIQSETGYLAQLRRALTTFELGQRESIAVTFGKTSPVRTLALLSLSESVTFISSLLDFMKDYMEHLTEAKFSNKKAYHVSTRVVVRVWKELFRPRQGVLSSFVANNHELNALHIFWASLRSLDIAMEMRRVGFENHHLVASELVKFLTLHSGSSDVGALVTRVTGLSSLLTELRTSVNGAQAAATTASNKANEALRAAQGGSEGGNKDSRAVKALKEDIKTLKRRLDALEGGGGSVVDESSVAPRRPSLPRDENLSVAARTQSGGDINHRVCSQLPRNSNLSVATRSRDGRQVHAPSGEHLQVPLSDDPSALAPREVEVGLLTHIPPSEVMIIGEHGLEWLLALEPTWCAAIHLPDFASPSALVKHLTDVGCEAALFNRQVSAMGLKRFVWGSAARLTASTVVLISGSIAFLRLQAHRRCSGTVLLLHDAPWRNARAPRPIKGFQWLVVSHASVGGPTQAQVLVGYHAPQRIAPPSFAVRRTIKHVLDFGHRGRSESEAGGALYPLSVRLPASPGEVWVRYQSPLGRRGWMVRTLTPAEWAVAYGVPTRLRMGSLSFDQLPRLPLQPLHYLFCQVLPTRRLMEQTLATPSPRALPSTSKGVKLRVRWGPSEFSCWLPHTWIAQEAVTAKAVKHDDAEAPVSLWNQRILLVLPHVTVAALNFLRSRLLVRRLGLSDFRRCFKLGTLGGDTTQPIPARRELLFDALQGETKYNAKLHLCHCSGKRMIAQGTDGVSRGHLTEGITAGASMLSFVPLNLDPLTRSPSLKAWVKHVGGPETEFLEPEDWFERGHDHDGGSLDDNGHWWPKIRPGVFAWSLAPAAASSALEELRKAKLKRQESTHIILIPRLLTTEWLKQVYKACDLVIHVPPNQAFWTSEMYEPLIIGLCFPYVRSAPWELRGTPKVLSVGRRMSTLCEETGMAAGNFLREFLLECRKLPSMPSNVVRRMLYFTPKRKVSCAPSESVSRKRKRRKGQQ